MISAVDECGAQNAFLAVVCCCWHNVSIQHKHIRSITNLKWQNKYLPKFGTKLSDLSEVLCIFVIAGLTFLL